ncbi:MAG: SAM-dependent methyltransferase, partial [Nitrospinaceae bacterium]
GKLLMFEHVLSKNPIYGLSLRFMSLFTNALEGTHLDRNTVENVRKAGFTIQSEQNVYLDIVKTLIASP